MSAKASAPNDDATIQKHLSPITPVPASPQSEIVAMSKIQDAPDDVVIQICQNLSVRDVLALRQVSFRFSA
jgi:hypothetical protein